MVWLSDGAGSWAYKVNADGGDVGLGIVIVGETQQQARLSHTGVTDEEQLEEVVVSGTGASTRHVGAGRRGMANIRAREVGIWGPREL